MDKVRLGIIGFGGMGSGHARYLTAGEVPEIELTAIADLKESRRKVAKDTLPETVAIFEDSDSLMDSGLVDAVLISVPHYLHPTLSMKAMSKGLHVMCEKPAGVYTNAVKEMNAFAKTCDVTFGMMFNQRTNCVYRKMHEIVNSGELGELKRVNWIITDWYRTQAYYNSGDWRATWDGEGGGVLLNQCPHQLDLLQWICGLPVKVQANLQYGKWHDVEVEDDVTCFMEFENGATGVFVTTTGDAPGTNRFEVSMTKGKLICENNKLIMYKLDADLREHLATCPEGFKKPECEIIEVETDGENPQHKGVLKAFAGNILHGTPLIANGEEGIRGLTLSNAMHLSSWTNGPVSIPFDEDLYEKLLNEKRASSRKKETVAEVTFSTEGTY